MNEINMPFIQVSACAKFEQNIPWTVWTATS